MRLIKFNEIVLTYEPSSKEINRICGHTFEVFDYYLFLKRNNFKVKILFQDRIQNKKIFKAFFDKYSPKHYDLKDFVFINNFKKILAPVIINTSGLYRKEQREKYVSQLYIQFLCNYNVSLSFFQKNDIIMADERIYSNYNILNTIPNNVEFLHYIKKFDFKSYKKISKINNSVVLVYLNSQLRKLNKDIFDKLLKKYSKILFVSGSDLDPNLCTKYNILYAPVENLFEKFETYLYTPTTRQFDCSPRLLTESFYYNKKILFNFDFDKYAGPDYGDTGLYWRWYDIQNNFNSLWLKEDDLLLKILKDKIGS